MQIGRYPSWFFLRGHPLGNAVYFPAEFCAKGLPKDGRPLL